MEGMEFVSRKDRANKEAVWGWDSYINPSACVGWYHNQIYKENEHLGLLYS